MATYMTFSLKQSGRAMSKHDTDTSDQHAAKRRWLNAHEEGYHKAMGNRRTDDRHWRRDWHRLVFRCRSPTANGGSSTGTGLFNLWLVFVFILRALGELVLHRPSSGSFVSYAREFLGEKAAYVAGWMYFINWAMTGLLILPPSLCICITGVRLAACRSGSLRSLHLPSLAP